MSTTASRHHFDGASVTLWRPATEAPRFAPHRVAEAARRIREPIHVLKRVSDGAVGVAFGGELAPGTGREDSLESIGLLPPLYPEWLGDRSFLQAHRLRFAYVTGEMANGIATTQMVIAAARAGMLGFFGSAGLPISRVEEAIDELEGALGPDGLSYGFNLIHTPGEPAMERGLVDLYLRRGIHRVCASAFMGLTESVVRYAASGLRVESDGRLTRPNHLFAKISRPEVARKFMSPAPEKLLAQLVERGELSSSEAQLARSLPIAEEITVEADSGGHTDNRPLPALFPTILGLRNEMVEQFRYPSPIRVGAAGGIGTPAAVASAFSMGAAYVVTGTINQAAVESGLSLEGKRMLARADIADVIMAPAADMFELGIKVQVLKRGTLFASRAQRLFQAYSTHRSIEDLPRELRQKLEEETFRAPLEEIWKQSVGFFAERDPDLVRRAASSPKLRMALVFRWYLGLASRWAIEGNSERKQDYQIWCGPAMGAFNAWVRGSFLEAVENRTVVQIALNLMEGAATLARAQQLRSCGVPVTEEAFRVVPRSYAVERRIE